MTFNYPTRQAKILNNLNLRIPATQKIALVGHSGCGKSTITNLLLRFYNVKSGKILIDGQDIDEYDVKALRQQIGYVMQEPVLFNASIKENLLYGDPSASDEQILKVCEMANALTFIESNVEDLEREQRREKVAEDLRVAFNKQAKERPNLASIDLTCLTEKQRDVMLQIMLKSDSQALDKIEDAPITFMKHLVSDTLDAGMKWDDVIINFEWTYEIQELFSASDS